MQPADMGVALSPGLHEIRGLVWRVRTLGHSARPFLLLLAALLRFGRSKEMPAAQRLASAMTASRIMTHLSDAPH